MCRPASIAGLGINDPIKTATSQFQNSKEATKILVQAIQSGMNLNLNDHQQSIEIYSHKRMQNLKNIKQRQKNCYYLNFQMKGSVSFNANWTINVSHG